MLEKHYAPRQRIVLVDDWSAAPQGAHVGALNWGPIPDSERFGRVEVLSPTRSLPEAAANFFAALRRLDAADLQIIAAMRFPDEGLGRALNDRLTRAAR
jgi:L-threonylcarbamoyladenylate synthase